ncbi:uncharacterized protein LOC133365314 [Rhineura floridana]|uniref:uncharacterized protein LOC133365314 n=1 Tax=Rhineura floridana TaxID=261503 RepID=UPI002AC88E6B|nr:uncharacterized protein LOC133365314 [Rhineura floridana]
MEEILYPLLSLQQTEGHRFPFPTELQKTDVQSHPIKAYWNLVLNQNKLALLNYTKPPGFQSQCYRKLQLLDVLEPFLPGQIRIPDINHIDYLFNNYKTARTIVSFTKPTLARMVYDNRDGLAGTGILISRLFKNVAPPQPLGSICPAPPICKRGIAPLLFRTQACSTTPTVPALHTILPQEGQDLPTAFLDEPLELEETQLIESFCGLPKDEQSAIVHRLDCLKTLLSNLQAGNPNSLTNGGSPHHNRPAVLAAQPTQTLHPLSLTSLKCATHQVTAEINLTSFTNAAQSEGNMAIFRHPGCGTKPLDGPSWTEMRHLDTAELGSPGKTLCLPSTLACYDGPISSNVSTQNLDTELITVLGNPME